MPANARKSGHLRAYSRMKSGRKRQRFVVKSHRATARLWAGHLRVTLPSVPRSTLHEIHDCSASWAGGRLRSAAFGRGALRREAAERSRDREALSTAQGAARVQDDAV